MINDNGFFSINAAFVLFMLLAVAVITDLRSHRIPNLLLSPALAAAFMLHTLSGGVDGLITAAGGLAVGLVMLLPLYVIGGLAAGDVKLLGVVGSFLGPSFAMVAGLATMMAGAVFGIAVMVWNRARPTLVSHAAQILSPPGTRPDTSSVSLSIAARQNPVTYIPYAPAIAVGTVAALWYVGYLPDQLL